MNRVQREREIDDRREKLAAMTPAEHIAKAVEELEYAERQSMVPAATVCYTAATAHAAVASAKLALRGNV